MKLSTILGGAAGSLTTLVGLAAAVVTPLAGLVLGGMAVYGGVAATMGLAATVALTAAGAVGGLILGRIAAPLVAIGALAAGGLVGGGVKLIGIAAERFADLFKSKDNAPVAPKSSAKPVAKAAAPRTTAKKPASGKAKRSVAASRPGNFSLKAFFRLAQDAQKPAANENATKPAAPEKKKTGPGI